MHTMPNASCTIENEKCITHNTQHTWTYETHCMARSITIWIVNYELCIIPALFHLSYLRNVPIWPFHFMNQLLVSSSFALSAASSTPERDATLSARIDGSLFFRAMRMRS